MMMMMMMMMINNRNHRPKLFSKAKASKKMTISPIQTLLLLPPPIGDPAPLSNKQYTSFHKQRTAPYQHAALIISTRLY